MKYYLDIIGSDFYLKETETRDTVYRSTFEDAGIAENDPDWTNKMDELFEKELGIEPGEWEVG